MADVQQTQHTPPGGWPWSKGKDASLPEHSKDGAPPPEYFDDKKKGKDAEAPSSEFVEDVAKDSDSKQKPVKDTKDKATKESDEVKKAAEDGVAITEEPEKMSNDVTKEGESNPMEELQKGLKEGQKKAEGGESGLDGEKLKDVEPEPLTEEEKEKLTPGGKVPDVEETTEEAKKDAEDTAEDVKKDSEGTTEDATKDVEAKEGELPEKGDLPEGEVPKEGEEAVKDGELPKEGELPEGEAPKEGEEALKEGEAAVEDAAPDLSILKNGKVNKGGNVINEDGKLVGRIVEGKLADLVGMKVDETGQIWNDSGKVVGKAEVIPEDERNAMLKEAAPFESFPDATVDSEGFVVFEGERVGKVIDGDLKRLRGMKVDQDGDILDRSGNVVGKAERWEPEKEPEPEPEPEKDRSILAGKRVNKAGNVVDNNGNIFGKVVEGDPKRMVGRMCDKQGNILSESGDILGKAEVVPEGEREGQKEGPFAELEGCTVTKDGKVVTPGGDVVGRLVSGDPKVLFGRAVDEDGDVCDKNGNVLGKAERWSEPEVEKKKGPMAGRRVNKEGNVVDEDGNLIGKLTSGELSKCAGKEIDDDGDVVDGKGTTVGHVSLIEDIKDEESPEDKTKREQAEQDKKLAQQMAYCLTQCLDKVKPICTMITTKIEKAERTPKEELDEEKLVTEVRPLIEEGGKILQEANGIIRGLDPDGRIQANAKHRTATRDATPEEYHLADILKELTGTVTQTIDNAKKKIEDMPHAKKELNPLWGLLSEPLFQILAAVGLLLNGVLGLVGRLLSGLGLGGLVDSLLGGLGVKNILEALGIGSLTDSLTGKKKGEKKKGGGLLGLGG